MQLTFLGTRGEIEKRTRRHRMHTSLMVSYRGADVMIDCGLDWLGKFQRLHPNAIVLTHAHADHAWGLKRGAPCPVYAPQKTWQELQHSPIKDRHVIDERTPTKICGITFEAFPVEHPILSPAVGYRVSAGRARIFYAPDLIFIHDRQDALKGVQVYIGVYSKAGQKAHWPFAGLHSANVVRKGRRTASYHFTLRLGDCYRRRTQAIRKTPRNGRRTRYRSAYRVRWNEAGAVMVTTVS
jgi:phosphoribosyl 1,2-cyclic phosphodiesterase